jgi:iron complex transport system substrate-binding protein
MKNMFVVFIVCCFTGCFAYNEKQPVKTSPYGTISDSAGQVIAIPEKIHRVIALNSNCFTMLKVIDALETVIGVSDTNYEALALGLENFGLWNKPNIEKIIEAKPDVLFAYHNYIANEDIRRIERYGIQIVYLEFYMPHAIKGEIAELAKLYRKEDAALPYLNFINEYVSLINDRLQGIQAKDRARVYYEGYADYSSVAQGSGGHELIEDAFCVNIAANSNVSYPKLNDEYIIEQNPDVILKIFSASTGILGANTGDAGAARSEYNRLKQRPLWNKLSAIETNRLVLSSSDIMTSPDGFIVGTLVIAKAAYPELFIDINPIDIYTYIQGNFFGNKRIKGVYIFP